MARVRMNPTYGLLVVFPCLVLAADFYALLLRPLIFPTPPQNHRQNIPSPPPFTSPHSILPNQQFSPRSGLVEATVFGGKFHILFCTSCSYRKQALQVKESLESLLPGVEIVLSNYPPPLVKRMLSKVVTVFQFGAIGLVFTGEQIFPRLGYGSPPTWFNRLSQNKFRTVATSWLLGNMLQNMLQGTGAFEIYYNGALVFSKLEAKRFPDNYELQLIVNKILDQKSVL